MPDEEKKKSFWETLPGIITAVATLVSTVGGVIIALKPPPSPTPTINPKPEEFSIELVDIPEGCFRMGSPPDEEGRNDDEGPAHEVCVDRF